MFISDTGMKTLCWQWQPDSPFTAAAFSCCLSSTCEMLSWVKIRWLTWSLKNIRLLFYFQHCCLPQTSSSQTFGAFLFPQDVPDCKFSYSTIVALSLMDFVPVSAASGLLVSCMDRSFDHMLSVHSKISKYKQHTSHQLQVFYFLDW